MPGSNTPPHIEQTLLMTAPQATSDMLLAREEKTDSSHLDEWPLNPNGSAKHPMFARAVFPQSAFIGPLPKITFGLCGLAPDRRGISKKEPAFEDASSQVIIFSKALEAIEKNYARPAAANIH